MTQARRYLDRLLGHLLPPRCVLCGGAGQFPALDLCRGCEADLPASVPAGAEPLPGVRRVVAAFAYDPPVDLMVQALKYRGDLAIGRVLGSLLARRILADGDVRVDCLLPVPLHPGRLADRGFNQSDEIARWVGRELSVPVQPRAAGRARGGRPQVGLPAAERQSNIRGAFLAPGPVAGRRIAIVDDVVTTGSTVVELAGCLRDAGALEVEAWCVARAMRPHETT
jgi:ComF family protein